MRVFLKAVHLNLKVCLAYPKGFLLSSIIFPIILVLNIYLFKSIYAYNGSSSINGYNLVQMIWYYAVSIFVWIFTFNFTDRRMSNYILSGELGPLLIRPFSLFRFELASALAQRIAGVLFEFVPSMLIYCLIYPPDFLTLISFCKFLVVVILAFFLHFMLNYLIGLSAVLITNNSGVNRIKGAFLTLLGGAIIPLEFFPEWLRRVCDVLPFKYIFYEPAHFFLNQKGTTSLEEWLYALLIQLVWIVVFYVIIRFIWTSLIKKVVVAGG